MWKKIISLNKNIYVYEESTAIGSLGSYLKEISQLNNLYIFGIPDIFIEHGNNEDLYKKIELDTASIIKKILSTQKNNID